MRISDWSSDVCSSDLIDIPPRSARAQIASALNIVIQIERSVDGRRRLVSVSELTGMEGDVITMQEIFRFKRTSMDAEGRVVGHYEASGIRPKFIDVAAAYGVRLPVELFAPDRKPIGRAHVRTP